MHWDSAARYRILLKINNAIVTRVTRKGLFQALATELHKEFAYDRMSINIYDPETQSLSYFAAAAGIAPEGISPRNSRPLDKGAISRMVIKSRKPVVIDNLRNYSGLSSIGSMLAAGLTASMAFPLIIRDRVLGTIHFSFKDSPKYSSELAEFLNKVSEQVAIGVDNMLAYTGLKKMNATLDRQKQYLLANAEDYKQEAFFFAAQTMIDTINLIKKVAPTDASILLTGETGTGKDYLARYIHNLSPRKDQLFVKVNCPAIAPSLFESELFGHGKGAFTGANTERIGRFEMANGGTVFLDEVGELPAGLQAKFLNVLQDQYFERVGESRPIRVNFRVLAATNVDLESHIEKGKFRLDLYYRLNTISIRVPPLRERIEDIPLLMEKLTNVQAKRTNRQPPQYTKSALQKLCAYSWPGNVRELKNLAKRMVILRPGEPITDRDINIVLEAAAGSGGEKTFAPLLDVDRRHIEQALIKCKGVVGGPRGTARLLGLPRTTLQYRLKKLGLNPKNYATGFHS